MKINAWLSTSLERQFPLGNRRTNKDLELTVAKGERISFQISFLVDFDHPVAVSATTKIAAKLPVHIRRVGCVPVEHHDVGRPLDYIDGYGAIPGYVPDPLFPESSFLAPPNEINTFWISVDIPKNINSGTHHLEIGLHCEKKRVFSFKVLIFVSDVTLKKRNDFRVTNWFYADAICDQYNLRPFKRPFWEICEKYMRNYAEHGCDTIYVPVFTPPLDGIKRPTQLLTVKRKSQDCYSFDWRLVKKWIDLSRKCGIEYFEWTHLFSQWGCENAIRIYEQCDDDTSLLWPVKTKSTADVYRQFLIQFTVSLKKFLQREKLETKSYFHISDEPHKPRHIKNYRNARSMLNEIAPWMNIIDAFSNTSCDIGQLMDIPIPDIEHVRQLLDRGMSCWTYYCSGPQGKYLNRQMDTPLPALRALGWLCYKYNIKGFLHWGYNYWYKFGTKQLIDPFSRTDGYGWPVCPHGDPFIVYPGADGPIDSIRWEVFRESLQDYALLQTLDVDRKDKILSPFRSFSSVPISPHVILEKRKEALLGK